MKSLRSAWIAPAFLIAVGCLQMVGDLTDVRAIKAVGAATGSSPAPKVFTAHKGFETYSSQLLPALDRQGKRRAAGVALDARRLPRRAPVRTTAATPMARSCPMRRCCKSEPATRPMHDSAIAYTMCGELQPAATRSASIAPTSRRAGHHRAEAAPSSCRPSHGMETRLRGGVRCRNSWTGGQYSLFRALFGIYLFVHFAHLLPWSAELFSSAGMIARRPRAARCCCLFPNVLALVGRIRWSCRRWSPARPSPPCCSASATATSGRPSFLWYVLACLFGRNPLIANPSLPYVGWMLLAHLFVPSAPYGSWAARGRADPGNGWRLPPSDLPRRLGRARAVLQLQRLHQAVQPVLGGWL